MIDGLKLTFSGEELRGVLDERIADHGARAERWRHERLRTKEDETEDAPLLPDQLCEHEEDRHAWRSAVLTVIRDQIEPGETYRLSAADMEFGELLPLKPGSVEQADYEDRHRHAFQLEQLTKRVGELASRGLCAALMNDYETTDGYRVSRIDVEGGPEVIRIEKKD
jgi:hypothetical protein